MTDIVIRLHATSKKFPDEFGMLYLDAKAEIERLKGEVEALREERKARDSKDLIRNQKIYDLWQDRHHSENTRNQKP